jgi:hypothetical protein
MVIAFFGQSTVHPLQSAFSVFIIMCISVCIPRPVILQERPNRRVILFFITYCSRRFSPNKYAHKPTDTMARKIVSNKRINPYPRNRYGASGKITDDKETITSGDRTCLIKERIENPISRFTIIKRTRNAVMVSMMAMTITDHAGAPKDSAAHEAGRLSNNIPPTTD